MYLQEILDYKKREVEVFKETHRASDFEKNIQPRSDRPFFDQLKQPGIRIIAEVKKASPSRGIICDDFDPVEIARTYASVGVHAVSVLTDQHFFQGDIRYLQEIRETVSLPLLRKDFILDEIQVLEAAAMGANACLLIVKALQDNRLGHLLQLCQDTGMDALVEVHDRVEVDKALEAGARIIGINNRNLETFETQLETTIALLPHIPESHLRISESGIQKGSDISLLKQAGADAFLVGESFMTADDKAALFQEFTHAS